MPTKIHSNATSAAKIVRRSLPGISASSLALVLGLALRPVPASASPFRRRKMGRPMPDGDGKTLIVAKCQLCHTLERV